MSKLSHEICIIGAGPVGLALANCLSLSPHVSSIALIDRKLPKVNTNLTTLPNQRVYSINAPSLHFLDKIGALPRIRQWGTLSRIQAMSRQSSAFLSWQEDSARIIQNDELVNSLLLTLQTSPNSSKIEFIEGDIESISNSSYSLSEVSLPGGRKIATKLLVGSDGNKSKVKQLSGINTYGWSYRQKAIACTLELEGVIPADNTAANQIYHDGNILGVLPLWQNYASIVWSLQIADYEHIMQLDDTRFVESLNSLISRVNQSHSGNASFKKVPLFLKQSNKRLAFPLNTLQSEMYSAHRLALVGDAAHSIHPMAGLGVNSGIIDSILLANCIISNKKCGNDIGQALSLSSFQSKSKAMNYGNSIAMQTIKKSFQIDNTPINFARGMVLNLLQSSDLFKSTMKSLVQRNPLIDIPAYEWEQP